MSLDNVIAIAASADLAAARVDITHAAVIKTTLIIFGLATSIPLIIAGSAILMALLERFRVLVWAGGALLGWVAGDIMATDPAVIGWWARRQRITCTPGQVAPERSSSSVWVCCSFAGIAHCSGTRSWPSLAS